MLGFTELQGMPPHLPSFPPPDPAARQPCSLPSALWRHLPPRLWAAGVWDWGLGGDHGRAAVVADQPRWHLPCQACASWWQAQLRGHPEWPGELSWA